MTADPGLLLYVYAGLVFKVAEGVRPPKDGSLLFCRHLAFRPGDRVLEVGSGMGLAAVLAARAGCRVVATDIVPAAVSCTRDNAMLNGVGDRVDARLGDCYSRVGGSTFDLICTNPPQMPTPPGRERSDAVGAADNGGIDGWAVLDRVIQDAARYLVPGGRLVFTLFEFLGPKAARRKLEAAGLEPSIIASETHSFPRIGYERLDHIRGVDAEGTLPAGWPTSAERYVIQGTRPA